MKKKEKKIVRDMVPYSVVFFSSRQQFSFEVYYTIRNIMYGSSIAALYLNVYYSLRARRSKHA
jgi:hypothetical protein